MEPPRHLKWMHRIALVLTGVLVLFLLVSAVLLALAPESLATPARVSDIDELDDFLERLVATENPPSVALSVMRNGTVVYERAVGYADGPARIEATPESVYRWWSLTKILTAIAVLQLHERGELDIEDEVREHLPFFETTLRGEEPPPIRIRHLLNHSAGLRNLRLEVIRWTHPVSGTGRDVEELIEQNFARFARLRATPGRRGRYTNFGYLLLGAIIERVSGQSYEDYVIENILEPLGMSLTGFTITDAMRTRLASGCHPIVDFQTVFLPALGDVDAYIREVDEGRLWLEPFYLDANAYGGVMGPVTDASRLLQALASGGGGVLEPETVALMLHEHRVRAGPSTVAPYYYRRAGMEHGLGLWVFPTLHGERFEHTGAGLGFATLVRLYPEEGLTIALLANGTVLDREGIADRVYELFGDGRGIE